MESIDFTPDLLEELKKDYNSCVERGDEIFIFQGHELLVGYAKFLIEYLESVFTIPIDYCLN